MTLAHLEIINIILKQMNTDDLLYIGITEHDYKRFDYDYDLRKDVITKNLLSHSIPEKHIKLVKQDKRTWNFLHERFNEQQQKNIVLILGEDEYNDLLNNVWHYSSDILNTYQIKVIPRTNNISATKVRELIKQHADWNILKQYITKETYDKVINTK